MYLEYLIENSDIKNEIENNETSIIAKFKETALTSSLFKQVNENLGDFASNNLLETYEKIKKFSTNYTLNYLTTVSKQLANQ